MNDVKYRDAVIILKRNGYVLAYQKGDHYHFVNGKTRIVLPFHMNKSNECRWVIWKRVCKENNIRL